MEESPKTEDTNHEDLGRNSSFDVNTCDLSLDHGHHRTENARQQRQKDVEVQDIEKMTLEELSKEEVAFGTKMIVQDFVQQVQEQLFPKRGKSIDVLEVMCSGESEITTQVHLAVRPSVLGWGEMCPEVKVVENCFKSLLGRDQKTYGIAHNVHRGANGSNSMLPNRLLFVKRC